MPNWSVLTTLILNDFLTKEWALCDFLTKGLVSVRLFDQGVRLCATFLTNGLGSVRLFDQGVRLCAFFRPRGLDL